MSKGVNIYPPFAACDNVTRLWWKRSPRSQRIISEKPSTMSGVCQIGTFATLRRLKTENLPQMERDLKASSSGHPIALVLPALYSEFGGNAMPLIREELCKVHCLSEIVVTLGQTSEEQFREAQGFLADMPVKVRIIWNDGPRGGRLYQTLETNGLQMGAEGKGSSVLVDLRVSPGEARDRDPCRRGNPSIPRTAC